MARRPADVTPCPKDLDRESKLIWRRTRDTLKDEGIWRGEHSLLLERYVRALEVGRFARQRIAQREAELVALRPEWVKERDRLRRLLHDGVTLEAHDVEELKKAERNLTRTAYTAWGSQGQLVPHPDLKTAREAERDANDYAKEMLLTPAARVKGGDLPAGKPKKSAFGEALGG